jgi:Gpi18-like mannosyltransferase
MQRSEFWYILKSFLIWRIGLFLILLLAVKFLVPTQTFLGGEFSNYSNNPYFWAWGNFDGQRYVSIAQNGYKNGEFVYFPVYSLLINLLSKIFGNGLVTLNLIGQIISNLSFLISLFGFYKLARIDLSEKVSKMALILLLIFPTSFYFASVYTESIFFALLVWSFYFIRQKRWFLASVLGMVISATRVTGVFVFLFMLIEWIIQLKSFKNNFTNFPKTIFLVPIGLGTYLYYLYIKSGNILSFFTQQAHVGEHRSSSLIFLPQIYYRYIFKIIPNLNFNYFPMTYTVIFEFLLTTLFLIIMVTLFFRSRLSYAIYALIGIILPTLLGSFSSMPRYVLVIFPSFFLLALYLSKNVFLKFAFYGISLILLVLSFSLFARGYWVS